MGQVVEILSNDKDSIIAAYNGGETIKDLTKRCGLHRLIISRLLREAGVIIRPGGGIARSLSEEQAAEARRLHELGVPVLRIAKTIGKPYATVHYLLVAGKERRERTFVANEIPRRTVLAILRGYDKGVSRYRLGLRFHISLPTLERILLDAGRSLSDYRKRIGPEHPNFKGGRQIRKDGYIYVWIRPEHDLAIMRNGRGMVAEHRLALASKLGRPLLRRERVHHLNGNKDDNRPENLELWMLKHPPGQRHDEGIPHCPTCTCGGRQHS